VRPVRRRNARSELSAAAVAKSMKSSRRENHARAHPTMREKKSIEPVVSRSTISCFIGLVGQSEGQKSHDFVFTSSAEIKTLSPSKSRDEHNEARSARPANMIAEAGEGGIFARVRKRMRAFLAFLAQKTRKATTFADLPQDIKTQILGRSDVIKDADLACLRAVSRSMRDAVNATMEDLRDAGLAAKLGCLTALRNLLQRGHLDRRFVCKNAAQGGHLEVLRWARANGCPWDEATCASAAESGHFEVLRWARANGCPWDEATCASAAESGHFEVLKWERLSKAGTTCDTCKATKTSQWYNSPDVPGGKVCLACYKKDRYHGS
jgi:hypothetical protein